MVTLFVKCHHEEPVTEAFEAQGCDQGKLCSLSGQQEDEGWAPSLALFSSLQESHCSPVQHLDMNMCDADCRNLFATVARDQVSQVQSLHVRSCAPLLCQQGTNSPQLLLWLLQVTIYDDMHMGDHVAVVGNLALSNTPNDAKVRGIT